MPSPIIISLTAIAILQLVVALQVTFMPLQFSRLLIFIVSIPFRWDAIDEMIVIIISAANRLIGEVVQSR